MNQYVHLDEVVGSAGALSFVIHEVPDEGRKELVFLWRRAGGGV